ncbi:Transmembrane protein 14A [Pteropus alecto]|uniref:Transmembrane protein 14A n=2 Tax=Pteropus TaxID=9401 RepID=L5JLD4_PTEAL|nr:Transmembrane protein 14A [Pteropus alecto]
MSEAGEGKQSTETTGVPEGVHEAALEGDSLTWTGGVGGGGLDREPEGRRGRPEDPRQERGGCQVLDQKEHRLDGHSVNPKKAIAMKNDPVKKIFVGGLIPEATEEKIEAIEFSLDSESNKRQGSVFITYTEEEPVRNILEKFHTITGSKGVPLSVLESYEHGGQCISALPMDLVGFGYAALVTFGSILGYKRRGGVPSLIAGLFVGFLAGYGAYRVSNDKRDVKLSLFTAFFLATIMGVRFKRSKKIMPAGLVAGLSLMMILRLVLLLL